MGLALSTSAAPERSIPALATACRSRGLSGIEVEVAPADDIDALASRIEGAPLVSLRVREMPMEKAPVFAKAAALLRVPISTPPSELVVASLFEYAKAFRQQGGKLLLEMGTNLDEALSLLERVALADAGPSLGMAWEIRPSTESLDDAGAVLFTCRERLGLVRLHGGGPEQREQEGRGLGMVLTDLALSRYTGPIVLSPSRPELLPKWAKWLASTKSAGCGTMAEAERVDIDVRDVEPRDRLDTILSAYDGLARGGTMRLTVDHDPSCMYYTLEAREAEGSFSFRKTEDGPEVWRAEVTKL